MSCLCRAATGLTAYDRAFDNHFDVFSSKLASVLEGAVLQDLDAEARIAPLRGMKGRPPCWGLRVRVLGLLWEYIGEDLKGYASAHSLDEDRNHVCRLSPCLWQHPSGPEILTEANAKGCLSSMKPSMTLVVLLYVKPWTAHLQQTGLALALNAGNLIRRRGRTADEICSAQVFISHCWNEAFQDFCLTVEQTLSIETVVWICSFAIWQHGDIAGSLSSIEACPFAQVIRHVDRVLAVTDSSIEVLERSWCVLEAKLAQQWAKNYEISLPDNSDECLWHEVDSKITSLSVENCKASTEKDRLAILKYARQNSGGLDAVNGAVRRVSRAAMQKAEILDGMKAGDLDELLNHRSFSLEDFKSFRSLRGRSATHVLAKLNHVQAMVQLLKLTENCQLDEEDSNGQTPLSVAASQRAAGSVKALVALGASVNAADKNGLTPLCHATISGDTTLVRFLLQAKAEVSVFGRYRSQNGVSPAGIACREGHCEILRELLRQRATVTEGKRNIGLLAAGVLYRQPSVVAVLLAARADPNAPLPVNSHETPLMLAFESGCTASAGLLIAARADTSSVDSQGRTCLDYSKSWHGQEEHLFERALLQGSTGGESLRRAGWKRWIPAWLCCSG